MTPRPKCVRLESKLTPNRVKCINTVSNRAYDDVIPRMIRNLERISKDAFRDSKQVQHVQPMLLLAKRYAFLKEISRGAFLCQDVKTKVRLMCRVFSHSCADVLESHLRLSTHPLINKIHEVLRWGETTFILSPSTHDNLLSYMKRTKKLSEKHARYLFCQICLIVKSCHEKGIVLRDLKMCKFAFSDPSRKILKFDVLTDSVVLKDPMDDLLRERRGCLVYMAPEILRPFESYCGKAADMWSLGVILYSLLVGTYPFFDPEHTKLFAKISSGKFIIPETLSPEARCLIRSLLIQDPKKRLTSNDIVHHPWMTRDMSSEACSKADLSPTDQCVPEFNINKKL